LCVNFEKINVKYVYYIGYGQNQYFKDTFYINFKPINVVFLQKNVIIIIIIFKLQSLIQKLIN